MANLLFLKYTIFFSQNFLFNFINQNLAYANIPLVEGFPELHSHTLLIGFPLVLSTYLLLNLSHYIDLLDSCGTTVFGYFFLILDSGFIHSCIHPPNVFVGIVLCSGCTKICNTLLKSLTLLQFKYWFEDNRKFISIFSLICLKIQQILLVFFVCFT